VIGVPPTSILEQSKRRKLFFDAANVPRIVANSRGKKRIPGAKDLVSMVS
jgi:dual specificity tyrosine-phosphorylation-regulated kinase 2/3/4